MNNKQLEDAIAYRREFHKYPEIGWKEIRTSARIAEILTDMGFEEIYMGKDAVDIDAIIEPVRLSEEERNVEMERAIRQGANEIFVRRTNGYPGVVAVFDTKVDGPTIAFRADIDALPYEEPEIKGYRPYDEGYISINKGAVHACGHDGHTAIILGLAEEIMKNKKELKGKIKLLFQPAEETFSGAESVVSKGHLDDVDYFVGIHLAISAENKPLTSNTIACGCDDFLSDCQLDVHYEGKSAHPAGASQEGKNALLAACTAALNLHSIAPHEEGLFRINVGEVHAGVAANTIAPNALVRVEYRGENNEIASYGRKRVMTIIDAAANMYDLKCNIVDYGEVPTAKSDREIMDIVKQSAEKVEWFRKIHYVGNVGGTDDATVMMKKVQENGGKATYIGLGTNVTAPVHNANFDFDEEVIPASIKLLSNLVRSL